MLRSVNIKNLALIREAEIDFKKGLNILTGETGAGKSIIIGAINTGLGDKANKSMLRSDAESGGVELLFTNVKESVLNLLKDNDIDTEEGNVIIQRKITSDSSTTKVNGSNVTLSLLKEITSELIDVHGQHDNQSLIDSNKHIDLLDFYGADEISEIKGDLKAEHANYRNLRLNYKNYDKTEEELNKEIEFFKHEISEISAAGLKEGEDKVVEEDFKRLSNAERVVNLLNKALMALEGSDESILNKFSEVSLNVNEAVKLDERLESIKSSMMDVESLSNDLTHDLRSYIDDNGFKPEQYVAARERLDEINHLKSKYGNSVEEILSYKNGLEEKIKSYETYFEKKRSLENKIHESGIKLNEISKVLSEARIKVASELEPLVIKNLKELNFLDCKFKINFEKLDRITENGFDKIEFLISTNPGEPLMRLSKIASGGEISRIMLAIKAAFAQKDEIETLIFDEIDTGISGKTAQMVGKKLYDISKCHQIICISHLPQIAAMADTHFHIHKEVEGGNTISGVVELNDDQMIKEIAKLVGGEQVSFSALENARDLKGNANFYKHKLT